MVPVPVPADALGGTSCAPLIVMTNRTQDGGVAVGVAVGVGVAGVGVGVAGVGVGVAGVGVGVAGVGVGVAPPVGTLKAYTLLSLAT